MKKRPRIAPAAVLAQNDLPHYHIAGVVPALCSVPADTFLFRQGDATQGIFRLLSGQLSLVRVTPDGAEVPMHTVQGGECFAEASLFATYYHCDAIAMNDCQVLVYPKRELVQQLKAHPEDLWAFTAQLAQSVQGLRTRVQLRQLRSSRERVLNALKLKCGHSGAWKLNGTLKQFAAEIGLTHESLYRTLAALETDGYIRRNKNQIELTGCA